MAHIPSPSGQPFTRKWLADPSMRVYNRTDFKPYPYVHREEQDHEVLNLFQGYNPAILTPLAEDSVSYRARMLHLKRTVASQNSSWDRCVSRGWLNAIGTAIWCSLLAVLRANVDVLRRCNDVNLVE